MGLEGDENRAEATLAGRADPQLLATFGLTQAEADRFLDVFVPIAASIGLRYANRREGEQLCLTFSG